MPRPPKLTEEQKKKLRPLELQLHKAARNGEYRRAQQLVAQIQKLIRPTGHETRLQKSKAWLYEAALEAGNTQQAISGFEGIRAKMDKRTRIYLEATALLAICHLRRGDLEAAEPRIAEAFDKVKNISSERRRRQFYRRLVDRFESEWMRAVLTETPLDGDVDPERVQREAGELVARESREELFLRVGRQLSKPQVDRLLQVYEFSRNQLPRAEQRLLPSPEQKRKRREVGKTVLETVKRVVWRSLCDSDSDVYDMWYNKGIMVALDKKVIGAAIASALSGLGLGGYALTVPITAIVIKMGVEVFCEAYEPESLMIGLEE